MTVSESIQTSLLACMILKEQGIKSLVAKAKTDLHGKLLQKIGVDKIIFPEKDMAIKIAKSITTSSIIDYIELTRGLSVAELEIPEHLEGKTLQETDLRSRYGLTVLAIISPDKTNLEPTAGDKIEKGDIMVVVGKKEAVSNIDFK